MSTEPMNKAKRQQIQNAVDHIVAGKATEEDYDVIRDRDLMYHCSGDQAAAILKAATEHDLPQDVHYAAAETLRLRWSMSPLRRSDDQ